MKDNNYLDSGSIVYGKTILNSKLEEIDTNLKYFGTTYKGYVDSSFDLNNLNAGESCYYSTGSEPSNYPSATPYTNYFVVCMYNVSTYGRVQICFPDSNSDDNNIYIRFRWTTWKSWKKIPLSSL